jgi:hypothetical protein
VQEGDLRLGLCCLAPVRFPPLDPRLYIRTRAGGTPFPVRQSQLRTRQPEARHEHRAPETDR